ncbi:O-linked N-acetylglucosamine transferase family protein [Thiomonas sp.]
MTYGCFNQAVKLNEATRDAWIEILRRVPGSKLFLKNAAFGDEDLRQRWRADFASMGVASDRLIFEGWTEKDDYLASFQRVDVGLDPFPYTGGTTTIESLWMGVPVVTRLGQTLISRQGYGIMMNVGLGEWVASDWPSYIDKAVDVAADLGALALLRRGLRDRVCHSPVLDAPRFARHMREALFGMWSRYGAGKIDSPGEKAASARKAVYQTSIEPERPVWVVSATQRSEQEFWECSALGRSLREHLALDRRLEPCIAFDNRRGLPEVFNAAIDRAPPDGVLIFIHDDVWIDDVDGFADRVLSGLLEFDVIGVAGNRRRMPGQTAWGFLDTRFTPEDPRNLSGRIGHGAHPGDAKVSNFGTMPAACELLDGVFIATTKKALAGTGVQFDPRFGFHFYDLDFCRAARKAGLRLGTWPIALTHQSVGGYFNREWLKASQSYLAKWKR